MERGGRPLFAAGLAGVVVVLVAIAATSDRVPLATEGSGGWHLEGPRDGVEARTTEGRPPVRDRLPSDGHLPGEGVIEVLAQLAVILAIGAVLFLMGRALLRVARSRAPVPDTPPDEHWPARAEEMVDAVDQGLTALSAGPIDEVIVECWVRLEEAAAAVGAGRLPAETPAELAARVLHDLRAPASAVSGLLHRYRQARYSHHPLAEDDRMVAVRSLEQIRAAIVGAPA